MAGRIGIEPGLRGLGQELPQGVRDCHVPSSEGPGRGKMPNMGEGGRRRHTVREASELLSISQHAIRHQHAIRQRIQRNTLESEKTANGRVYVLLDIQHEPSDKASDETSGASGVDPVQEMLREHNQVLREQLTEAHEANREMRRLLAALTSRIPELESSPEPPDAPETAAEGTLWYVPPGGSGVLRAPGEAPLVAV
jgi:hypothetical protein